MCVYSYLLDPFECQLPFAFVTRLRCLPAKMKEGDSIDRIILANE